MSPRVARLPAAALAPLGASAASAVNAAPSFVEEPLPAAPLSPISQARAREAAMVALNLAQAALPPPPAAAVQPVVARPGAATSGPAAAAAAAQEEQEEEDKPDPTLIEMKLENAHYNLNEVLGANLVAHPYYRDLGSVHNFCTNATQRKQKGQRGGVEPVHSSVLLIRLSVDVLLLS